MNTILKRLVSLLLCFTTIVGYVPVNAFAEDNTATLVTEPAEVTNEAAVVAESDGETEPEKPGKPAAPAVAAAQEKAKGPGKKKTASPSRKLFLRLLRQESP